VSARRRLIVNADDFGLSQGVNAGILAAHQRGIVTSASLMVRQAAAAAAAESVSGHPALAVGLHLDLGEWAYEEGEWRTVYERCPIGDEGAVERECREQLKAFRKLLGRDPTHLDSHQHTHTSEPVASVTARLAEELGVPLRGGAIRYEGGFYGQTGRGEPWPQGISVAHLISLVELLPGGWTELACHPGIGVGAEGGYGAEREQEVVALCDPRVRATLEDGGVEVRSFAQA
jgi:chitin disaccharide deacetylase